jgi:flagellin
MANHITLTAGTRTNLLSLKNTEKLLSTTNERLSTGKKVNNAIDNPVNFFASINLHDRADGLQTRLDGMGQAVQTLKAAEAGVKGVRTLIANMQALVNQAFDEATPESRRSLGEQFNQLLEQAQELAKDSVYQGTNLLQDNETLTVQFNERFDESLLTLKGINIQGPGIRGSGLRDSTGEVPVSDVVGVSNIASKVSIASTGTLGSVASRVSTASHSSIASAGSTASIASVASATSVASLHSSASQGSVGSIAANIVTPSSASVASQSSSGSVGATASIASIASRPGIPFGASSGTTASLASRACVSSRASSPSSGSVGSIAASSIVQQFALTMNSAATDRGTDQVLGIQAYGKNSNALGEHEMDWGDPKKFKDILKTVAIQLEKFDASLNVELANIATNVSVLNIREEFTGEMMTTLRSGSDKLVLTDMNEEGANLLALQTRQQLGLSALQLATQQSQQVLRLLQ